MYELLVPLDNDGLRQGLEVLSEFACRTRIAPGDLEKERGAVLEEWRQGRDSRGRAFEAWWKVLYGEGSRYAERLPIGLEKVIRGAPPEVVKGFYHKWYRPENMAIVAVGDFASRAEVVALVREVFGGVAAQGPGPAPPPVRAPHVPHSAPRFLAYVEKELTDSSLTITFKRDAVVRAARLPGPPALPAQTPRRPESARSSGPSFSPSPNSRAPSPARPPTQTVDSVARLRQQLVEDIFCSALSHRLFKLSRKADPVFYSAACVSDDPVASVNVFYLVRKRARAPERLRRGG